MDKNLRRATDLPETDLAIVCWHGVDTEVKTGCPLPVRYAEAVARAFQNSDPARRYWVESLPWLVSLGSGPGAETSRDQ